MFFWSYTDDPLRSPFDPYGNSPVSAPNWLTQQELAPIDSSTYPVWWEKRNGITPNGFHFKMTQEEFEKISYGSEPVMSRPEAINTYNELINYFNQLDYSFPPQIKNFNDWKIWWGKSLDLVIPKSDLVDEYNAILFKGSKHSTFTDTWKLDELETKISPLPRRDAEPIMIDLGSHSRAFPFRPYIWNPNIESNYKYFERMNKASGKYKRTKKQKKSGKSKKLGKSKKYTKKHKKKNSKNTHNKSKH